MQALNERFEMRLDQDTLRQIDAWRSQLDDLPGRSEAIRRLVETGLATAERAPLRFSSGETLIIHMLCELFQAQKIESEFNPEFIQDALLGGHYWALEWEYVGTFHRHVDSPATVTEVVDTLDMWSFIEEGFEALTANAKARVAKEVEPFGKNPVFFGFDGNNETEHYGIARFLIEKMERFQRFKGRELNSHHPSIETHRRMYAVFEPIRATLAGTTLAEDQIIKLLKERIHPSHRKD